MAFEEGEEVCWFEEGRGEQFGMVWDAKRIDCLLLTIRGSLDGLRGLYKIDVLPEKREWLDDVAL